jgi:hypothetical protein
MRLTDKTRVLYYHGGSYFAVLNWLYAGATVSNQRVRKSLYLTEIGNKNVKLTSDYQ